MENLISERVSSIYVSTFVFYRNTVVQLVYIHEWEWNNIGAVVSKQAQCILCVGYKFKSTHLVRLVGGPL